MTNYDHLSVCTECMTYNHEAFIEDTLHGFVIQKTSFPVEYVIVDDASTDQTATVIRRFVENQFVFEEDWEDDFACYTININKENPFCRFIVLYLKRNLYFNDTLKNSLINKWKSNAKYIARCEGDDYWTDPLKLQKQVDFLESHPEYSMCCHRYDVFNLLNGCWEKDYVAKVFDNKLTDGISFTFKDNLEKCWFTKTMTVCYRWKAIEGVDFSMYKYRRDVHDSYYILKNGPGYCLPDKMAVYRKQDNGVWASLSSRNQRKTTLLVFQELSFYNADDRLLKESYATSKRAFFSGFVYEPLTHRIINKEVRRDIRFILKCFLKDDGILCFLNYFIRTLYAFIKGVFRPDKSIHV